MSRESEFWKQLEEKKMRRETDKLMLKLPVADVAAWLRSELRDTPNTTASMQSRRATLLHLIAKLGEDEALENLRNTLTLGEIDERT